MTLLVVVVLVMLISLSAYRYTFVMESEYRLTRLQEELVQARLSALSGIEYAAHLLEKPRSQRSGFAATGKGQLVFRRATLRDDSVSDFRNDRVPTWQFGLISPSLGSPSSSDAKSAVADSDSLTREGAIAWRWGVENESAKLSIPAMLQIERTRPGHFRTVLLSLGMDEVAADAWLDQLGVSRANGAVRMSSDSTESNDASQRSERDASRDLLGTLWFGGDLNQNYRLDPIESQLLDKLSGSESGITSRRIGNTNSQRWQPLQRYFTWMNGERNERQDGSPRIYLNQPNLQQLHQQLIAVFPVEFANFVVAYRQYGPNDGRNSSDMKSRSGSVGSPVGAGSAKQSSPTSNSSPTTPSSGKSVEPSPNEISTSAGEFVPVWTIPARFVIQNPLDLVGAAVALPSVGKPSSGAASASGSKSANKSASAPKKILRSPFSGDSGESRNYLGKWLSDTTVVETPVREGRVDVSEAPVEVLRGIPGIDATLAQRIVEQRRNLWNNPDALSSIAWLLETGVVDVQKFREIEPFLTHRSDVYTVQSIGFRDNRSPVYRCTVTIDARRIPASLIDLKVWHPWDRGFDIDSLNDLSP